MRYPDRELRPFNEARTYAVLLPLIDTENGRELLFEKRSSTLKHQAGDLCFPGGKVESEARLEGALRETMEELEVKREQIEVIGSLPGRIGPDGCAVWPFAARLLDYRNTFSTAEVDEVIRIPLSVLKETSPEIWHANMVLEPEEGFPLRKEWTKKPVTVYLYRIGSAVIWGLTAQILHDYLEGELQQ